MWPLYLLFNKLLKTEEENNKRPTGNHLTLVESWPSKLLLSKEKHNNEALSQSGFVEVPHISQQDTWDCGLACVLMVLRTLGIDSSDIQELEVLCCTTSNIRCQPKFFCGDILQELLQDQLPSDLWRVDMLFQKARDAGINIECRSISGQEISQLVLSRKYIAIALVDQYILSRSWLQDVCISGIYDDSPGYTGHYVIICGYDAATDEFEIRDPASSRKHEKISLRRLEEARKAFGTDEDLLLISLVKE